MDRTAEPVPRGATGIASRATALLHRCLPGLLAAAVLVLALVVQQDPWQPVLVAGAVASAAAAAVARRRPEPLFAVAAATWLTLGMWPATVAASYYAATSLRRRALVAGYAVTATLLVAVPAAAGVLVVSTRWSSRAAGDVVLLVSGLVLVPMVAGLWVDARRQVLSGLRLRAAHLEREQVVEGERARTQERARIAREMHDVVAHRVTLMVLQAGALEVSAPDAATATAAAEIRRTGRDALGELRQVLGVLRTGQGENALAPQPGLDDLPRLLESVRELGVPVAYRAQGTPGPLTSAAGRAVYRIVQEALLNVRKHAPGASAEVVVRHSERVVVEVRSGPARDEQPRAAILPRSGLGLAGLAERVDLLGGELVTGPEPGGGFLVRAVLPGPGSTAGAGA